jgi:hypothetical protein
VEPEFLPDVTHCAISRSVWPCIVELEIGDLPLKPSCDEVDCDFSILMHGQFAWLMIITGGAFIFKLGGRGGPLEARGQLRTQSL